LPNPPAMAAMGCAGLPPLAAAELAALGLAAEGDEVDGPEAGIDATPRTQAFEEAYHRTPRLTVLGRGSFGVTYAARSSKDPKVRCAVKEISMTMLSEKHRREALAESELLRTLSHRNVVACFDAVLTGACLYIVMECATQGDLSRHIGARRETGEIFPEDTVMVLFVQICSALAYIHKQKIMHRDLKPANIFVFGDGDLSGSTLKLGDFGLGKVFKGASMATSTVGSPSYFSPEVCRSKPYGRKSDLWSLGVVLYELAALALPFNARVVPALARVICLSEPSPLPERYGPQLHVLVAQLLQKAPERRPTAAGVLEDPYLQRYLARLPATSPVQGPGHGGEPGGRGAEKKKAPADPDLPVVRGVFQEHDDVDCGSISVEKLSQTFQKLSPSLTPRALSRLLDAAGVKRGDEVDYDQFLEWLYH